MFRSLKLLVKWLQLNQLMIFVVCACNVSNQVVVLVPKKSLVAMFSIHIVLSTGFPFTSLALFAAFKSPSHPLIEQNFEYTDVLILMLNRYSCSSNKITILKSEYLSFTNIGFFLRVAQEKKTVTTIMKNLIYCIMKEIA